MVYPTQGLAATVIVDLPQTAAKYYFYNFEMKIIGIVRKCSLLLCNDAFISIQHPYLFKWTIFLKDVLSLPD